MTPGTDHNICNAPDGIMKWEGMNAVGQQYFNPAIAAIHLNVSQCISKHLNASQFISIHLNSSQCISKHLIASQFISIHLIASQCISGLREMQLRRTEGLCAALQKGQFVICYFKA